MRNVGPHWLNLLLVFSCSAALMACCVASLASMPASSSSALPSNESCSAVRRSTLPVSWWSSACSRASPVVDHQQQQR